jgi:hypothetical protein
MDADLIASVERLTIGLVVNAVTGTSPTITVQLENSPDGTRWLNQGTTPEINAEPLSGGDNVVLPTSNQASRTASFGGLVRLRVAMGGTSPAGSVRLWLVGRSPAY